MKLKHYFTQLRKAHEWFADPTTDRSKDDRALERVEQIYTELEKLGIEKAFAAHVFVFGSYATDSFINQFQEVEA